MRTLMSTRGQAVVVLSAGLALAGAFMAIVLNRGSAQLGDAVSEKSRQNARETAEKAVALGGFLVANNLVLCREDGWSGLSRKCRWGGDLVSPAVDKSVYYLEQQEGSDQPLTFNAKIDFEVDPLKAAGGVKLSDSKSPVKISFDLINDSKIKNLVGEVSASAKPVDQDHYFVAITAQVPYLDVKGNQNNFDKTSLLRRPMGTPFLGLPESPQCPAVCSTAVSEGPHPECRGPQDVADGNVGSVFITVTNYGPGPIYRLNYKKTVAYDKQYFPDLKPVVSTVNAMATQEVLMPGQSMSVSDVFPCVKPKTITKTVVENETCSRRRHTCPANLNPVSTSISSHQEEVGDVRYDFDLTKLSESLEPARLARRIDKREVEGDIDQAVTEKTTVKIHYIPTH